MRRWTVRAGRDLKAMASQIHEAYDYIDFEDVRSEPYGTPSGSLLDKLEAFPETMRVVPLHAGFVRSGTA
jgi:hypothetical protein